MPPTPISLAEVILGGGGGAAAAAEENAESFDLVSIADDGVVDRGRRARSPAAGIARRRRAPSR